MADVFSAIEGVSRFFQWLYNGAVSIWQSFSLVVIFIVFLAVQVGFIYIYYRIGMLIIASEPRIKQIISRIDRFFS
jgi:hypothetical protein